MSILDKEKLKNIYLTEIIYEIHILNDKANIFVLKYNTDFEAFETQIKSKKEEDFEKWDDYLEWKSYNEKLKELIRNKTEIENGNLKVA